MPRAATGPCPSTWRSRWAPTRCVASSTPCPGADPVVAFRRRKAMVPLTDARDRYTLRGERREIRVDTLIVNREQIDWIVQVMPGQEEFPTGQRAWSPKPTVPKPAMPEPALTDSLRSAGPCGRPRPRHAPSGALPSRARCPPTHDPWISARSGSRSPGSAWSTARRSWPGRTARCCSATSARTWSRSSHPRATPRVAGARRGSARTTAVRGPPPTTWRSTGTSAASGSTSRRRPARGPASAAGARRRRRREPSRRRVRPARLRRRDARTAEPRDSSTWRSPASVRAARRQPARLRLRHPGGQRPDVDHRRPRRRGGGPTKVGVAISDVVTGMLGAVSVLAALARP